jgi:putative ATP-dependent endonuclease of OLD family
VPLEIYLRHFKRKKKLLGEDATAFPSLIAKHFDLFIKNEVTVFDFAEKGVDKKTTLAIDILLNSERQEVPRLTFANWKTPAYIKEGLEWLRK